MNQPVADPATLDFFSAAFLLPNVGAPFVVGLAVGYFAKKILKVALFLGGAAVVLLFIGEYYGYTHVDDQALHQTAQNAVDLASQSGSFLYSRLSQLTWKGGSAVAGFLAGLKIG
ncbi:FUN14 domain-containing protein [Desulfobulbus rhabdoformis]|uniref:FUN14 domain-containing protein n=1 Tax=Desulfobulbus rhabdoformis TaxID=34032 RepID=UPI00196664AF|nr:FUN14 domain-containing protein [Desulfobulbus rhabdoformis]MBM9616183.1 FUN14 domain-containing protein [Desulfobulbus rhabdoformis]